MLLELIIYAAIAVFMLWRLYTLLGSRDGFDRPSGGWFGQKSQDGQSQKAEGDAKEDAAGDVIDTTAEILPSATTPDGKSQVFRSSSLSGTKLLKKLDPTFDQDRFLAGAPGAFRLIVEAFAKADWPALHPYVTPTMAQDFQDAHQAIITAGHRQEQKLLDIRQATLDQVWIQGTDAFIRVRFVSEQILVVYDAHQQIVEGHPTNSIVLEDLWTFTRPLASRDPQWWLAVVDEPEEATGE
ncbi:MAG: Tim44/TimA family putative adaptor protein [Holosporaceae bacterium]